MSEFDDRVQASAEKIRQRANEIAAAAGPTADVAVGDAGRSNTARRRWVLVAASVAVACAGVAGLVAVNAARSGDTAVDTPPPPGTVEVREPVTTVATQTTMPPATNTTPATTDIASATDSSPVVDPPGTSGLSQPIVDPAVCEPFAAMDGSPTGLPLNPGGLPFTLFARPSELPIPIQVIGHPIDGPAQPFAIVERFFAIDRPSEPSADTVINGIDVQLGIAANGNGEAIWNLADGTQGYVRSRGIDRDDLTGLVAALSPRSANAAIPGFDYDGQGPEGLELVTEEMNTDVNIGPSSGSQCRVVSTDYVYRIWTVSGGPLYQFASVIDRPPPVDVGIVEGAPVIISGIADPAAPSIDDVIQADDATWQRLLDTSQTVETSDSQSIGTNTAAVIEFPIAARFGPNGYLSVSLSEVEGVTFLEIDTTNAVIDDEGQYWKLEVNDRVRSRSTARAGGVMGFRLSDTTVTEPFRLTVSVTDGDDFIIQTTGPIDLQPT